VIGRRVVVYIGALMLLFMPASCAQDDQLRRQMSDLQAQVADLQATLADVNLRMEEMNSSMFVLRETARNNREAIRKLQQEMQRPSIIIEQPAEEPEPGRGVQPPPQANGGQDADTRFRSAMQNLSQNNWGLAIYDLNAFLAQYPNSEYAPRAHFSLGEAYRNLAEFAQAVREYELCLGAGELAGPYAPRSLYWLAICFDKLGNAEKAKLARERLLRDYPDSPEAKKVKLETSG